MGKMTPEQEGDAFLAMKANTSALMDEPLHGSTTGPVVSITESKHQDGLEDWQARMLAERDALQANLEKLGRWLSSPNGNRPGTEDHADAVLQYSGMEMYLQALNNQIKRFPDIPAGGGGSGPPPRPQ